MGRWEKRLGEERRAEASGKREHNGERGAETGGGTKQGAEAKREGRGLRLWGADREQRWQV